MRFNLIKITFRLDNKLILISILLNRYDLKYSPTSYGIRGRPLPTILVAKTFRKITPRLWLCHPWPTFGTGGGIGGGGILVPIYITTLDFLVKNAIPLASITVLGGAIANNLLNVRKVHPDHPDRPAIDWDLMLLLQPMMIAGALIGVDLNKVLPEILLLVIMPHRNRKGDNEKNSQDVSR